MNRSRTDCQNGCRGKSSRHHVRHRFNVRVGILSISRSAWPDEPPGGDASINTTARYTRRPANRTDGEVERAIAPSTGEAQAPGIILPHRGRTATGFSGVIRHVQRTFASGATPQASRGSKLCINAGQKMKKGGILQYGGTLRLSPGLVNRRLPGGDLLIKIPDGDPTQTITKLDRRRPIRHQERWPCSPTRLESRVHRCR